MMNLCLNCRRRLLTCVCAHLEPFDTNSRFVILMHPKEYKKEKVGTGRFAHLILRNSRLLVDVGFDENREFKELLEDLSYDSFVLYPGSAALNLSEAEVGDLPSRPKQFFVIDGTWPCAKKMMKLTTALHDMPRVSFSSSRLSEFKVKHQPMPGCLSTVESIHQVLLELNRLGVERSAGAEGNLIDVFRRTVDQQIELAQDPKRQGYRRKPLSLPEERKTSKKWTHRALFFRGPEN